MNQTIKWETRSVSANDKVVQSNARKKRRENTYKNDLDSQKKTLKDGDEMISQVYYKTDLISAGTH